MSDFQEIVYKDGGLHQRPGGTFSYRGVRSEEELEDALNSGWFRSIPEMIAGEHNGSADPVDENSPPTREELEAKANELGIKFTKSTKNEKLLASIKEALKD
jgi:hypothetical protein